MEEQDAFWLASDARHAAKIAWWYGFSLGLTVMFIVMMAIGLFLP